MARVVVQKKRQKKNVVSGIAHITSTFNNTLITITDNMGNVIASSSAGVLRFSGSRKSTPYAAQMVAEDVAKKAEIHGVQTLTVLCRGVGSGRDSAIRTLSACGLKISLLQDITPIPYNGCKPPKRRRA